MDKYEYKLKLDEIETLAGQKNYAAAAQIADGINWRKVRNVKSLMLVGEIYQQNGRYEDSKELYAYERSTQQQNIRIIANYGGEDVSIPWENTYKLLLNNMKELLTEEGRASLRSGQVIVLEV